MCPYLTVEFPQSGHSKPAKLSISFVKIATNQRFITFKSTVIYCGAIFNELIVALLGDYKKPEDHICENGFFKMRNLRYSLKSCRKSHSYFETEVVVRAIREISPREQSPGQNSTSSLTFAGIVAGNSAIV